MKKLGLRTKLFLVVGLLSSVAMVSSYVGVGSLAEINSAVDFIVDTRAKQVELAGTIQSSLIDMVRQEKNIILAETNEQMTNHERSLEASAKMLQDSRNELLKISGERGQALVKAFDEKFANWYDVNRKIRDFAKLNSNIVAQQISSNEGRRAADEVEKNVRDLMTAMNVTDQQGAVISMLLVDILRFSRAEKNMIIESSDEAMKSHAQSMDRISQDIERRIAAVEKISKSEHAAFIQSIKRAWQEYATAAGRVRERSLENGNTRAFQLSTTEGRQTSDQALEAIVAVVDFARSEMAVSKKTTDEQYAQARNIMLGISLAGILVALMFSFYIVQDIVGVLRRVFGGLKNCSSQELNDASVTMRNIIGNLTEGSEQVSTAAGQVSSASQSLAESSSEQAASLEETSSSLEELASMAQQNNNNAHSVNELMRESMALVKQAQGAMSRLSEAIEEIKSSSDETSKIVKTIDEIAFQTNLLALNAAVEAARAGDAGRGFAVVADEVGNLAQRAGEAARNTGSMIEQSVKNAERGVAVAQDAAQSLSAVTESSAKVSNLIAEITSASGEQTQGIGQINKAVTQLDVVTQQNSSTAEESAAASEELSAQADRLLEVVAELKALVGSEAGKAELRQVQVEKRSSLRVVPAQTKVAKASAPVKKERTLKVAHEQSHTEKDLESILPLEENDKRQVAGF